MLSNRNEINIAILGTVSAGKSTLNNAIFTKQYSDMKIKRTTMVPQVYHECDDDLTPAKVAEIKNNNKIINERLIKKTENGQPITLDDIDEIHYMVPFIPDFIELSDDTFLAFYDIPGLNDSKNNSSYFSYIENNFGKFNIILFVIDVASSINTSDEMKILRTIISNIKKNHADKKNTKLIVLVNKCDEMTFESGVPKLGEELEEMFKQAQTIIRQTVNEIYPKFQYDIIPIASEDAYIYRTLKQDPTAKLDDKHINKFGYNEFGKSRWTKMRDSVKEKAIRDILERAGGYENALKESGFITFRNAMKNILTIDNQYTFICSHVETTINKILQKKITIDEKQKIIQLHQILERIDKIDSTYNKANGKTHQIEDESPSLILLKTVLREFIASYFSEVSKITAKGIPKNDSDLKSYLLIKENLSLIFELFGLCETELKSTVGLIAMYYINLVGTGKTITEKLRCIDELISNNYKEWKKVLLKIFSDGDYDGELKVLLISNPTGTIKTIEEKYGLSDDETLMMTFNMIVSQSCTFLKNQNKSIDETTIIHYNIFSRKCFWNRIVVRSTNKYCLMIQGLDMILSSKPIAINWTAISDENGCKTVEMDLDVFMLELLKKKYPKDIVMKDDLIDMMNGD